MPGYGERICFLLRNSIKNPGMTGTLVFWNPASNHTVFIPCRCMNDSMKNSMIGCFTLVLLCIAIMVTGCTSSKAPVVVATPVSSESGSDDQETAACPDTLVWDGDWQSSMLSMAGNHDLSTAWTKYADRPYGDVAMMTMKQTCRDVEANLVMKGINCSATFKGTVEKNVLSGTWSAPTMCGTKSEAGRKFSLTMAADNKSWLGDMYSDGQDPSKFPPNWAGRRPVS